MWIISASRLAFEAFARRRYWNRLWIVQETALARGRVVLCGEDVIPFDLMRRMSELLSHDKESERFHDLVGPRSIRPGIELGDLLNYSRTRECQDPRDRVYAILGLVEEREWGRTLPDYTISELALAVQVARAVSLPYVEISLEALRLSIQSNSVTSLMKLREHEHEMPETSHRPPEDSYPVRYVLEARHHHCSKLWISEFGQLQANFESVEPALHETQIFERSCYSSFVFSAGWRTVLELWPELSDLQCIWQGSSIAALVGRELDLEISYSKYHLRSFSYYDATINSTTSLAKDSCSLTLTSPLGLRISDAAGLRSTFLVRMR